MIKKQLAAECIGTMMLVATVVGSGIMAQALASGNDALALLGNTIATGAILYVLITVLGPISGAHFNPAVSIAFFIRSQIGAKKCLLFILVQIAGGIAGSMLAHLMFELPVIQFSEQARSGLAQYFSELVATAGLIGVILGGIASRPHAVPMLVGLYISAAYWFTASTSFANPAVTIARSLSDTFSGISPADMPFFILAQLAAIYPAVMLCRWLFSDNDAMGAE
jgi:glycerol uptake facilitator-like aquaporin